MTGSGLDFIEEWGAWTAGSPPYVLAGDADVLSARRAVLWQSWDEATSAPGFAVPDGRLHLALLPQPFIGDMRNASVYVLLLNPGLGPTDYFGENEVPAFREALLDNLAQRFGHDRSPFLFLDPRFAWHGGFAWWNRRLTGTIEALAEVKGMSVVDSRKYLGQTLASIELLPYHSSRFTISPGMLARLESVQLARRFVRDYVVPRVRRGEAIVIVARQARAWGVPEARGVVTYAGGETRAAYLTPPSRGGRAILEHLAR